MPKVTYERALEISLDQYIIESGMSIPKSIKNSKKKCNYDVDVDLDFNENGNVMVTECNTTPEGTTDLNKIRNKFCELEISSPSLSAPSTTTIARLAGTTSLLEKRLGNGIGVTGDRDIDPNWERDVKSNKFSLNNNLTKISTNQNNLNVCAQNRNQRRRDFRRRNWNNRQGNNVPNNDQNFNKISGGKVQKRFGPQRQQRCKSVQRMTTIECSIPDYPGKKVNLSLNSVNADSSSNSLNSCGKELPKNFMSIIAGKLLNALLQSDGNSTEQQQESKYDMKVQKVIHSIQDKPMVCKCPGGEIISSDGSGVDLKLTPNATNLSFNQRFS